MTKFKPFRSKRKEEENIKKEANITEKTPLHSWQALKLLFVYRENQSFI